MEIQDVIRENQETRRWAAELNRIAGQLGLFPVMSQIELTAWLKERLGGARRLSEVRNFDALLLPQPDKDLANVVVQENPDDIRVCGRRHKVEYRDGCTPRITLDRDMIATHSWRELPDAGVRLPGGRLVEVVVSFSYYDTVSGQNIFELKARCVSKVNKNLWDNWSTQNRPAIVLPDPADPTSVVPEIIECQYGISVIDRTSLIAFGTVALRDYRYYSSDPWFEDKWFQVRDEANAARMKSVAKLEEIRGEAIRQKQIENARQAAESAKRTLRDVCVRQGWYDLESDLRSRVDNRRYDYLPPELEDLQEWTQVTNALIVEVEAAFKAKAEAKAAAEIARQAADESDAKKFAILIDRQWRGASLEKARAVGQFVSDCIQLRGDHQASRIFRQEASAHYGRDRRASALERSFPGVDHHGLDWAAGRDIELVADWADHFVNATTAKLVAAPKTDVKPVSADQVTNSLDALRAKFGKKR